MVDFNLIPTKKTIDVVSFVRCREKKNWGFNLFCLSLGFFEDWRGIRAEELTDNEEGMESIPENEGRRESHKWLQNVLCFHSPVFSHIRISFSVLKAFPMRNGLRPR